MEIRGARKEGHETMIDREKYLDMLTDHALSIEFNATDGKHALYCAKDASPLVEFWREKDYEKAEIDTNDKEGEERQAKQGRAKRFAISKWGCVLTPANGDKSFFIVPSFAFRVWAGNIAPVLGYYRHFDALMGYVLAVYLDRSEPAILDDLSKRGEQISKELEKDSTTAQNSIYPIEMILNYMASNRKGGLIEGEAFSAFLDRSLNILAKRKAETTNKAAIADIDALISDLSEIKGHERLMALWEGIFKRCQGEAGQKNALAVTTGLLSTPSGRIAANIVDTIFDFTEALTDKEKDDAEKYIQIKNRVDSELKPKQEQRKALTKEKERLEAAREKILKEKAQLDATADDLEAKLAEKTINERIKAIDKELSALSEEMHKLEKEKVLASVNLMIIQDKETKRDIVYVNHPINCPSTITNEEGRIAMERGRNDPEAAYFISVSTTPYYAKMLSDSGIIKMGLPNATLRKINEKCKASKGEATIFFSWQEVYDLTGAVNKRQKMDARAMFDNVTNALLDLRIDYRPKKEEAGTANVSFHLFPRKETDTDEEKKKNEYVTRGETGVTLTLDSAFAQAIGGDPYYVTKSARSARLPAEEGNAWDRLRRAEHLRQAQGRQPIWDIKELATPLNIRIDSKNPKRTRDKVEKLLDGYYSKGLLEEWTTKEERERANMNAEGRKVLYRLLTKEGAKDLVEAAKEEKVKALASDFRVDPTEARQVLNRCDGDMELAKRRIQAGERAKDARYQKRAAKAKEKKETKQP